MLFSAGLFWFFDGLMFCGFKKFAFSLSEASCRQGNAAYCVINQAINPAAFVGHVLLFSARTYLNAKCIWDFRDGKVEVSCKKSIYLRYMDLERFRDYCLTKPGVTEEFPFDEHTLVYKVMGKMFAATDISDFESINLKCLPEKAEELRAQYESVQPGYHMNKKHWNTIQMDHSIPDKIILEWIDDSYRLVVTKLPKQARQELGYADLNKD